MLSSKLPKISYILAGYASYQIFLKPAFNLGTSVYNHWLRPRANLIELYGPNSYALVTGSTSGIGKAVATELSREGFNLVLFGRSDELLAKTKEEIQALRPDCKIETRKLDLMNESVEQYRDLPKSVDGLDISVVVNNAGYMSMSSFVEEEPAKLKRTITTNIGPYVYITKVLLPQLKKRESKSAIVFTASGVATNPTPIIGTYAASKAFSHKFAESLGTELQEEQGDKIDILSYLPGIVASKLSKQKEGGRMIVISPENAARTLVDKLGYEKVTAGSWKHAAMVSVVSKIMDFLPQEKKEKIFYDMMKQTKEENEKAAQ